jgi:hypothetical protein
MLVLGINHINAREIEENQWRQVGGEQRDLNESRSQLFSSRFGHQYNSY